MTRMDRDESVGFGKEFVAQFQADDASGMAAELAYRWLFALFPFGIFLAALGAFVAVALARRNRSSRARATTCRRGLPRASSRSSSG
jgi:uncharacterized BrkB/YihY/UPF0761 family membrane protein